MSLCKWWGVFNQESGGKIQRQNYFSMKKTHYFEITKGLFYRRTKGGNIVLKRKQHTKMTIKENEIYKLIDVLSKGKFI